MKKKTLQAILAVATMAIGVYMLYSYAWPAPPAVSGLGFLFAGLALWIPHCPIARKLLK